MQSIDSAGLPLSGGNEEGVQRYEQAARELRCLVDDPVASVEAALAASPDLTMAHALLAWLYLVGTEPAGPAAALRSCDAGDALEATERERAHLAAARALAEGRWAEAGLRLEDLSARYPRDLLALQVGHQVDFFRGDSRMLRDRVARALPAWGPELPGWHALLGMYAFGLEETGDYAGAEKAGQRSVALEPRDSWAWHAVAHVHEMRGDTRAGLAWLEPTRSVWSPGSFLSVHLTWHLALFHLELDHHDEVLRLYDEAIGGADSALMLELVDQSSLLWRLHLRGVATGPRFEALAERWAAAGGFGQYAFNDLHAMLAFVVADRPREQRALLEAQERALDGALDNAAFTREVGRAATLAVEALGRDEPARAVALLRSVRSEGHRFGGSHAQRDLLDLSLLEAAARAGDAPLAAALAAERLALRPHSALAQRLAQRWPIAT